MSWHGLRVWVTRPQGQAGSLCDLIRQHGGVAHAFPTIELNQVPLTASSQLAWLGMTESAWAVVLSANALHFFSLPWSEKAKAIAIGPATAQALCQSSIPVHAIAYPPNSEGLLALPMLQDVKDQQCFVLCGQDPRTLLIDTLQQRGANVIILSAYCRVAPAWQDQQVFYFLQQHQIEVVVLTSMSGVKHLVEALDQTGLARLRQCCAVVVGDRMAKQCQNGQWFAMIYVADDASDASIVLALEQCANH